jgi:hypothetical protein
MPAIQTGQLSLPSKALAGGNQTAIPSGYLNELVMSELMAKYSTLVKLGVVYSAYASVTAPVIFSTAAGTGGPLIWNRPNSNTDAHILAISYGSLSTATSVSGSLGLAAGVGQTIAPTATTAIDATGNMYVGGPVSKMGGVYRIGTTTNAGSQYMPVIAIGTGAITAHQAISSWIDIGGSMIIAPGTWGSPAANATLTSGVIGIGILWAELPS